MEFADRSADFGVLAIPERIDAEHLHIDTLLIHRPQTILDHDEVLPRAFDGWGNPFCLLTHQVDRILEVAMRVSVNRFDTLALDYRAPAPQVWFCLCMRGVEQSATAKSHARHRACVLEESSAISHVTSPFFVGLASLRVTSDLLGASIFNNANYCVKSHSCLLISPPLCLCKVLFADWPGIACL
jgi:hypothetical protein